jgi:hypothetical protein
MGGISTDITERKKMEDSLKAADKFFNMSLDIMVITSNDKFIKLIIHLVNIGIFRRRITKSPFLNYVHPEDQVITRRKLINFNRYFNYTI